MAKTNPGRLLALLSVLVVTIGIGGLIGVREFLANRQKAPLEARLSGAASLPAVALGATYEQTRDRLEKEYAVAPDRRFLLALTRAGGNGVPNPSTTWTKDAWKVTVASHPRDVRHFATFTELLALVEAATPGVAVEREGTPVEPDGWLLAQGLGTSPTAVPNGLDSARSAIRWAFHMADRLDVGDEVASAAIASLAVAERRSGATLPGERAVLARALGYEREGKSMAEGLPPSAVRAYLLSDDASLHALSQKQSEAALLWHRRLVELHRDVDELDFRVQKLAGRQLVLEVLASRLLARNMDLLAPTAQTCMPLVELHAALATGNETARASLAKHARTPAGDEQLLAAASAIQGELGAAFLRKHGPSFSMLSALGRIEKWIEEIQDGADGSSKATRQAWYRALTASCVGTQVTYLFDTLGARPERLEAFTKSLAGAQTADFKQLEIWAQLLTVGERNRNLGQRMLGTLSTLDRLGGAAWARAYEAYEDNVDYGAPSMRTAGKLFGKHLDARPTHRLLIAGSIAKGLQQKYLLETAYGAWYRAAEGTDPERARTWRRHYGATAGEATDGTAPAGTEADDEKGETETLDELRKKLDPTRNDWHERQSLTRRLRALRERPEEVRAVISNWLERFPSERGFGQEWALGTLAEVELEAGHLTKALDAYAPIAESYKFSSIHVGTLIALAARDFALATRLSQRGIDRYPASAAAAALVARVSWVQGNHDAAASFLASRTPALRSQDWYQAVRPVFQEVFRKNAPEAQKAALALSRAKIDTLHVSQMANGLNSPEDSEVAFAVLQPLKRPGMSQLELTMSAYLALKRARSEKEALDWLAEEVPPAMQKYLPMVTRPVSAGEVLWRIVPTDLARPSSDSDYFWLTRAADTVESHSPPRPELVAHFKESQGSSHYHVIGRYLLDLATEAEVMQVATTPRTINEVTYFRGLKALAEGRFEEGFWWYQASVETGELKSGEYRWAFNELFSWMASDDSTTELSQRYARADQAAKKTVPSEKAH